MKIYWVENTNPVGGRFIIAKSESSAFDIGVKIGMVRDPRNLHVKQAEEKLHTNSNINEITKEGIAWIKELLNQGTPNEYRVWATYE